MKSYKEIYQEVLALIRAPQAEEITESYSHLSDVYRGLKAKLGIADEGIKIPGWEFFNRFTGGLREREFSILCGPTGVGKTTLLANIACPLLTSLTPIFVASVEIGEEEFVKKMISIVTGVDFSTGRGMSPQEIIDLDKVCGSAFRSKQFLLSNYDSRIPHMRLLCDMYYMHKNFGTKVALVDNLNFMMEPGDQKNQILQMDKATHDFVVFCKKVPMHVIMVMHPKKTEHGRVESEFDIKGSSTAVQEASNVILWNRLKDKNDAPTGCTAEWCREIKLAKVRKRGRSTGARIIFSLDAKGERMREVRYL